MNPMKGVFRGFDIAASGLHAEMQRSEIVAANLANINKLGNEAAPPYRRRAVIFDEILRKTSASDPFHGIKGADKMNTGHVTWADEMKIWFVMVKDKTNRFPDNPIWGDGWGWALFEAKDPAKNTTTNYRISCIGCHLPVESTDWVFLQGYPELKKK